MNDLEDYLEYRKQEILDNCNVCCSDPGEPCSEHTEDFWAIDEVLKKIQEHQGIVSIVGNQGSGKTDFTIMKSQVLDQLYSERNELVRALFRSLKGHGINVAWKEDEEQPDWPVWYIPAQKSDAGVIRQMGWHIGQEEMDPRDHFWIPEEEQEFDGHDTEEKLDRLRDLSDRFEDLKEKDWTYIDPTSGESLYADKPYKQKDLLDEVGPVPNYEMVDGYGRSSFMEYMIPDDADLQYYRTGGYQGKFCFVIRMDGEIWLVNDYYGSCGGCDAFIDREKEYMQDLLRKAYCFDSEEKAIEYLELTDDYSWNELMAQAKEMIQNPEKNKVEEDDS